MKYTIDDLELVVQCLRKEEQTIDVGSMFYGDFAGISVESIYCVAANVIQELINKEKAVQVDNKPFKQL
jgi:hypothetical protein